MKRSSGREKMARATAQGVIARILPKMTAYLPTERRRDRLTPGRAFSYDRRAYPEHTGLASTRARTALCNVRLTARARRDKVTSAWE